MIAPVFLLVLSALGAIYALTQPGAADWLPLAGLSAVASLLLLLKAWWSGRGRAVRRRAAANHIIVDGSNVMHWKGGPPQIGPLREVIARLLDEGFAPAAVFDANAGHKIGGRYMHDQALGRAIGLPADRVLVVDKGTPADPVILAAARGYGARIVTNDRYRDWLHDYPEAAQPGTLIRGGYRDGRLWLDL